MYSVRYHWQVSNMHLVWHIIHIYIIQMCDRICTHLADGIFWQSHMSNTHLVWHWIHTCITQICDRISSLSFFIDEWVIHTSWDMQCISVFYRYVPECVVCHVCQWHLSTHIVWHMIHIYNIQTCARISNLSFVIDIFCRLIFQMTECLVVRSQIRCVPCAVCRVPCRSIRFWFIFFKIQFYSHLVCVKRLQV